MGPVSHPVRHGCAVLDQRGRIGTPKSSTLFEFMRGLAFAIQRDDMIYWISRLARLFVVINTLLMLSGLTFWFHEKTRLGTEQWAPAQAPSIELPQHLRDLRLPRA